MQPMLQGKSPRLFRLKSGSKKLLTFTGKHLQCSSFFFCNFENKTLHRRCFDKFHKKFSEKPFFRTPPGNYFCCYYMDHSKKATQPLFRLKLHRDIKNR